MWLYMVIAKAVEHMLVTDIIISMVVSPEEKKKRTRKRKKRKYSVPCFIAFSAYLVLIVQHELHRLWVVGLKDMYFSFPSKKKKKNDIGSGCIKLKIPVTCVAVRLVMDYTTSHFAWSILGYLWIPANQVSPSQTISTLAAKLSVSAIIYPRWTATTCICVILSFYNCPLPNLTQLLIWVFLIKRKSIPTYETEPLFLYYGPIKSETYFFGMTLSLSIVWFPVVYLINHKLEWWKDWTSHKIACQRTVRELT